MGSINILRRFIGRGSPDGEYVCRQCRTVYDQQRQVCPECGGYSIERTEWPAEEAAEAAE